MAENVTLFFDPVNDSGLLVITTCPAAKPPGKVPGGEPLVTSTETLPNKPSRRTVMDVTSLSINRSEYKIKVKVERTTFERQITLGEGGGGGGRGQF